MIDILDSIIQIPYTTSPKMVRNSGDVFNKHPQIDYINQKQIQLSKYNDLYGQSSICDEQQLIQKASRHLGLPEYSNIKDFALVFEEDLAIMHHGKLAAICFCFPSSWVPAERIGLSLTDIHRPVADNAKLVAASDKISKTISDPVMGSFKRYVWTITNNPGLSNHPMEKIDVLPKSINDLYFRLESQTTCPLKDGVTALFFVKVEVFPLVSIWNKHGLTIRSSINSMSDAILTYKNLKSVKEILNNVLLM